MSDDTNFDNHVVLLGAIVSKNNQVRYFADGTAILQLDIVVKRKWTTANGQVKENSCYTQCRFSGPVAEQIGQQAVPGKSLYLRGQLAATSGDTSSQSWINVLQAQYIDKPTKLFWNSVHLVGQVTELPPIQKSINNKDLLSFTVEGRYDPRHDQATQAGVPVPVTVKLWGAAAKMASEQLTTGQTVLVQGSLQSTSQQIKGQYQQQHWLDGQSWISS